jgi:hypothetical protein
VARGAARNWSAIPNLDESSLLANMAIPRPVARLVSRDSGSFADPFLVCLSSTLVLFYFLLTMNNQEEIANDANAAAYYIIVCSEYLKNYLSNNEDEANPPKKRRYWMDTFYKSRKRYVELF